MPRLIRHPAFIYFVAGFFSILISFIEVFRTIINPDGICYLQSAETMHLGILSAMHLCDQANWPLYSFLIYLLSSIAHLSFLNSAYFINGFFTLISVMAFLAIVQQLNGTTRALWFAVFVILFSHELNYVKQQIVRDHGFWAFYLISIFFLLNYFRTRQGIYAIGWSLSLVIATLFRIEGCIFLLLIPFVSLFIKKITTNDARERQISRMKSFIQLNILSWMGMAFGFSFLFFHRSDLLELGRLYDFQYQFIHGFNKVVQQFHVNVTLLKEGMLNQYAGHNAKIIFVLVLLNLYFTQIIGNLTILYTLLIGYAWYQASLRLEKSEKFILVSYIVINVLITSFFLAENLFLASRYLVALTLTLMIWVPFALESLSNQWKKSPLIIGGLLWVMFIWSGLIHGDSKRYIRDAGSWVKNNAETSAKIYSNNYLVMYYSKRFGNDIFSKSKEYRQENVMHPETWKKYDYVVLEFNKNKEQLAIKELGEPIKTFINKEGDEVIIYQIKHI